MWCCGERLRGAKRVVTEVLVEVEGEVVEGMVVVSEVAVVVVMVCLSLSLSSSTYVYCVASLALYDWVQRGLGCEGGRWWWRGW